MKILNFFLELFYVFFRVFYKKEILKETLFLTAKNSEKTLVTVLFAGLFVGAILALQFYAMLASYDAYSLMGGLNTSALIREVGPLIISFLIAGKIGAFTSAELGSMAVTEQFDAIRCLGRSPIEKVIFPRFISILASGVLLLGLGLLTASLGAMWICEFVFDLNSGLYLSSISKFVGFKTIGIGFLKCFVYSFLVGFVSCYEGFYASGGASGVGLAVTRTSIRTNLSLIFANFFMGQVL